MNICGGMNTLIVLAHANNLPQVEMYIEFTKVSLSGQSNRMIYYFLDSFRLTIIVNRFS